MNPGEQDTGTLPRRFEHLLLQLARQARRDLERLPHHPKRAVHALRTRMKKLAAIVRLVRSGLPERSRRAILDSAKRLKNAFTAQRDAQVALELGYASRPPRKPPAQRPLFEEVGRLTGLIETARLGRLRAEDIREAYVRTYRSGRKRMKECLADPDPKRLHSWRKPVKELYYQSLALHQVRGMKRRIRQARRLGRWLGRDHDWQLIVEHLPPAARTIGKKRARLRRRIFRQADRLYGPSPRKLARKLP